jgi:raffinose synthase
VLRGAMLSFYASASDFTRRLTSVAANGKFSRLDAGPEEDWEDAVEDFKAVVAHIKQRWMGGLARGGGLRCEVGVSRGLAPPP